MTWVALVVIAVGGPCAAQDDAAEQATWLLKKATLVHRDSFHNVLLRALRQMRDADLEPLFSELVQRPDPEMKLHGILALAEISPDRRLDLALVADLKDAAMQAQLVSAAIDGDLLEVGDARQLLSWPGLDASVRVIVAARLVHEGQKVDPAVLDEAVTAENPALRGMAAMIQLELGRAEAMKGLDEIRQEPPPVRRQVCALLLQTAERYEFHSVGPWAMSFATGDDAGTALGYQGLRLAMASGVEQSINTWLHRYDTADRAVERIRLAMLAIDLAERIDPRVFDPLLNDDVPLVRLIGETGKALAAKRGGREAIGELIEQNHAIVSRWAYNWAGEQDEATARPVLVKLVRASATGPDRFRAQRLELAVLATQSLYDNGDESRRALRRLIAEMPTMTQEAMLMGLIRSHDDQVTRMVEHIDEWDSKMAAAMALLLRAKHGQKLNEDEMRHLALIVRGGVGLQEPLRAQAAWTYLKLTRQNRVALATVLGR